MQHCSEEPPSTSAERSKTNPNGSYTPVCSQAAINSTPSSVLVVSVNMHVIFVANIRTIFIQVNHLRGRQLVRKYRIISPFKRVVKTMRYRQVARTARSTFKAPELGRATLNALTNKVRRECRWMCNNLPSKSLFKNISTDTLKGFDIEALHKELVTKAPVLFAVLQAAGTPTHTKKALQHNMTTMAAAVLLKARSQKMCMLQTLVGTILYTGHASKRVRYLMMIINPIMLHGYTGVAIILS